MSSTDRRGVDVALDGQVAVVTGAARGIGSALVEALLLAGASVLAIDRDRDELAAAVRGWSRTGDVSTAVVNVASWADVADAANAAFARTGRLDIWVNNAGVFPFAQLADLTAEDLETTFRVNVSGAVAGARASSAHMASRGRGTIVNISSIAAVRARSGRLAYDASKAALEHATRCLAIELGPLGIRVNAIAPGYIDTAMLEWIHRDSAVEQAAEAAVPLGRIGQVDDVVGALLFLVSDAAAYITGAILPVDGGLRAGATAAG